MNKNPLPTNRAIVALLCVTLLALVVPVTAYQMTIDLDKTYQFKATNVSTIEAVDLGDLSVSRVEILSTEGDDSDLQTIRTPVIRQVTRNFTSLFESFKGIDITITGTNPSTVDATGTPAFKIYTTRMVPTFRITVPGQTGNAVLSKYNDSWVKEDSGSISSLFRAAEGGYLYKATGMINVNATNDEYTVSGVWNTKDYDKDNITFTLNRNEENLDSFTVNRQAAYNMGDIFPYLAADTGKYYAGALAHDEATQTLSVYAMSPVVVLEEPTPLRWTNSSGTYDTATFSYFNNGTGDDVTLDFTGTSPGLMSITNVTYLIINDTAQYDMDIHIDTAMLAEKAEVWWQTSFTPGTQIIDLLYDGIGRDAGSPNTYTLNAVGYTDQFPPSTTWSTVAITPGYGISGTASGTSVTVPAINLYQLDPGLYDLYVMGTDADNNIVALDQKQVTVSMYPAKIGVFRGNTWLLDWDNNYAWDSVDAAHVKGPFAVDGYAQVRGDWNGDGIDEIGIMKDGLWYIDYNGNGIWDGQPTDRFASFGQAGDNPVVGDWNGDHRSEIGSEKDGFWVIDLNGNFVWDGQPTDVFAGFGQPGDNPVVGDWNHDGVTEIGSELNGFWSIDYNGNYVWDYPLDKFAGFGQDDDNPVVGDWNHDGATEIGSEKDGFWSLDYNGNYVWDYPLDKFAGYGQPGDYPVVGDWNADNHDDIASFKNGFWSVDYNGNHVWDYPLDKFAGYGMAGDIPLAARWR